MKRPGIPAAASALGLLADGANHSGEQIAVQLGISRAAVWKQIQKLRQLGVQIEAVRGSGYCLTQPIELLDRQRILHEIGDAARARLERLDVVTVIDSTNSALLTGPRPVPGKLWACLAEYQRGGRGRRGRAWLAPLGRGLCMSVAWTFAGQPGDFAALGLAAGVAVRRALLAQTGLPIRIKWPNDLLVADRKLGGILVEISAESHGPCFVVIGLGINVSATPALPPAAGAWAGGAIDLATAAGAPPPSRNGLAAAIIDALTALLSNYATSGFAAYRSEFAEADYLFDRDVIVDGVSRNTSGRAVGVGADGRLLLERAGELVEVVAGDVSVRPRP